MGIFRKHLRLARALGATIGVVELGAGADHQGVPIRRLCHGGVPHTVLARHRKSLGTRRLMAAAGDCVSNYELMLGCLCGRR